MGAQILWFQSHELKSKAEGKGTYLFWLTRQLGVLSSLPRFKMLQPFVSLDMVKLISRQRLPFLLACFQVLDEKFEIVPTGMDFAKGVVGVVADSEHETFKTWIRALFKNFDEDLARYHISVLQDRNSNKNKNIPLSSTSRGYPQMQSPHLCKLQSPTTGYLIYWITKWDNEINVPLLRWRCPQHPPHTLWSHGI